MPERILVVDDAPENIQAISAILRAQGYQVLAATDGARALEVLKKLRPDLLLLDVIMPELDGFEVCKRLKATPEFAEIPVIFLTGKSETEDVVRGFEVGAVDYVTKPFNSHELLARVRTHLEIGRLNRENMRLLLNILPAQIAERLKHDEGIVAERFDEVSVLFTDIVGFTPLSTRLSPTELVELLNRLFSRFDEACDRHGVEKIKTIGDAYMAVGGLPETREGHLTSLAKVALEMLRIVKEVAPDQSLDVRVGIHVGSAVAGVIGIRKFSYDVWGDTVNTASRLEHHGAPGRIHASDAVFERLSTEFSFEPRGAVELKGRGVMNTYFLLPPDA
ncbi:MAG TPA: adenylate/guanylate cyclase domain-containing protein [Polyangiaceae bacterium]|nr:adenylate/guanylate cyclase domain-containing protein [Polyangiaceae bacterium]